MSKKERERIEKAFAWVQRKLHTNYHLVFQSFDASKVKDLSPTTYLTVVRSERDREDPLCFLVGFDPKNTKTRSFNKLRNDAFHEMIHAINWVKKDILEEALVYIKSVKTRRLIRDKFYDADEAATYVLERAVGPYVLPRYQRDE